ncbi:unnamed protein product [Anisakis simplex]|uniref:acetyl-CoA C-acetyltransferase n=1 Tax=Anisakis simplex TaxID=6269 RepID=A0A0M3JSZ5_ANISI|nr:unnamed protein product [Anisakis simplex]
MATTRLVVWSCLQTRAFSMSASCGMFKDVVICGGLRTPIGSFRSKLSELPVTGLGAAAIYGTLEKAGIKPSIIQEAFVGVSIPSNAGPAPARQAILGAGLDVSSVATGINKMCSSGMKAIMLAAEHLQLGAQDVRCFFFAIGAGMENMSRVPFFLKRGDIPYGGIKIADGIEQDVLMDPYANMHIGACADKVAKKYGITREEQDDYVVIDYDRAITAWRDGIMANEIVPIEVEQNEQTIIFDKDEQLGRINTHEVPMLKSAFSEDGTITMGNMAAMGDGAAAVIMARVKAAEEHHIPSIARILSVADAATDPDEFAVAPALVIPRVLEMAGLSINDIDLFEIHDQFAIIPLLTIRHFELDPDKVNAHGGSISFAHPIGMSGARLIVHLLNVLRPGQKGLAAICNGGGGAAGMIIERL